MAIFSKYNNESGGAFIYVLMISFVLIIFVPGILSMVSATQLQDERVINQKKVTTLAVSGMKAFIDYPGTDMEKKNFLASTYGITSISQPEGTSIDYYQYGVYATDSEDFENSIPINEFTINQGSFKAVFAAIAGDLNHNGIKDDGERLFYKKQLSYDITIASEKTSPPDLEPLFAGDTFVSGTSLPGASVKVIDSEGNIFTGTADHSGNFSVPIGRALLVDEIIQVTAKVEGKLESSIASITVLSKAEEENHRGLVKIIDRDGNVTYQQFQPIYSTNDEMIVTSSVGNYITSDCDKKEETNNCIDLTAGNGLTIEEGVSLTTENNGNIVGISLKTTGGDITINSIDLKDLANSNFSHITIESADEVYMNNTSLYAVRDITISAAGNIYANNATLTNIEIGLIQLELLDNDKLYGDGLSINRFKNTLLTLPSDNYICGSLTDGNEIIIGKCL